MFKIQKYKRNNSVLYLVIRFCLVPLKLFAPFLDTMKDSFIIIKLVALLGFTAVFTNWTKFSSMVGIIFWHVLSLTNQQVDKQNAEVKSGVPLCQLAYYFVLF